MTSIKVVIQPILSRDDLFPANNFPRLLFLGAVLPFELLDTTLCC